MSIGLLTRYGMTKAAGGGGGGTLFWGIESQTVSTAVNLVERLGWRFTVGGTDLTVNALRIYRAANAFNERLMIHRVSDGVVIADGTVLSGGDLDAWVSVAVTEATLAAATEYTISSRAGSSARDVYRNPTAVTIADVITKTANVFGSNDDLPTSTSANVYTFVDFGYE